jgi:hypothetical protein
MVDLRFDEPGLAAAQALLDAAREPIVQGVDYDSEPLGSVVVASAFDDAGLVLRLACKALEALADDSAASLSTTRERFVAHDVALAGGRVPR